MYLDSLMVILLIFRILEALTNISHVAAACQTSYKLVQEVSGYTGANKTIGDQMWKRFQESTNFKMLVMDLESAFQKVGVSKTIR